MDVFFPQSFFFHEYIWVEASLAEFKRKIVKRNYTPKNFDKMGKMLKWFIIKLAKYKQFNMLKVFDMFVPSVSNVLFCISGSRWIEAFQEAMILEQ